MHVIRHACARRITSPRLIPSSLGKYGAPIILIIITVQKVWMHDYRNLVTYPRITGTKQRPRVPGRDGLPSSYCNCGALRSEIYLRDNLSCRAVHQASVIKWTTIIMARKLTAKNHSTADRLDTWHAELEEINTADMQCGELRKSPVIPSVSLTRPRIWVMTAAWRITI
jgi:hypothetical protein